MTIENIVRKIVVPLTFIANTAYAQEAKVATPEQIVEVKKINNLAVTSRDNDTDWLHQEQLIDSGKVTVLIQPVEEKPGYCIVGLDGFPQKYNLPADERTKDGKLEKAESILNLAEKDPSKKFYFPCDLKAAPETPNPIPDPDAPLASTKKKSSDGKLNVGVGYLYVGTAKDETTGFNGNMHGGSINLTYQPKKKLPYLGIALSGYGNGSSTSQDIAVPAADGPLAGKLVMKGSDEYSLQTLGLGLGLIVGGEVATNENNTFGFGLEGHAGVMHDWVTRKFGESSAQYVNGNLVEGTNISNHSDKTDTQFLMYNQVGARFRFGDFCLTPTVGLRTNFSAAYPIGGLNLGYCPRQE
ncbi:MAG: hypothetical protein Q8R47_05600 [Nanoarchaeota archaeon]|nr:hypothetical protein [Nanoarchaeota archaeon]